MAASETTLFKNSAIHWRGDRIKEIPRLTREIYILFWQTKENMNVVYVGIATGERSGIRSRIYRHSRAKEFTHFSIYEVWDNISERQVKELEGLFLHIYAKDAHANILNKSKGYAPLARTKREGPSEWVSHSPIAGGHGNQVRQPRKKRGLDSK